MTTINVSGFLTDFTGGKHVITLDASPSTVGQALDRLWQIYPGLRDRVLTEQGEVRRHVNVFLEGRKHPSQRTTEHTVAGEQRNHDSAVGEWRITPSCTAHLAVQKNDN